MIYIQRSLHTFFDLKKSLLPQFMALKGETFRAHKNRLTQRILLGKNYYFIKQHQKIRLKEFFKNILQGRIPITSARNEWQAIQKLQALGLATPRIIAFGEKGLTPLTRTSFVMMEALNNTLSLETFCAAWPTHPPAFLTKLKLIKSVALIARCLHEHGINHRDFYLCHFLLRPESLQSDAVQLYLIDLHRAGIRRKIPRRWLIKDLAGLYFSSKSIGLTQKDLFRFVKYYRQKTLREILFSDQKLFQQVIMRGERLYADHQT